MLRTTWVCEPTFPTASFMNSEYRSSISDRTLVSKLRCAVSIDHMPILKTWYAKRNVKHLICNFHISYILKLYFRNGIIITSTCFFLLILMLTESFKSHVWFTLCFYWTSQVWQFVKGRFNLHPQNIKYKSQINKCNENKMVIKYV